MMELFSPSFYVALCFVLGATALWVNKVSFISSCFTVIAGSTLILDGQFYMHELSGLSQIFSLMCSGVGLLVAIYSCSYFSQKRAEFGRFIFFLFLFFGSMLGLLYSETLIKLFVYWEMTSITSFLLIGFNYGSSKAREAARTGLLVTGAGGLFMLAGFVFLGIENGSYSISKIQSGSSVACALILMGIFTKSAQFPFQFWLPKAMKAPTPASAFLHSAAMVKAGPYLILLLTPVFKDVFLWGAALKWIGLASALVGVWMSVSKRDLKEILAGLTISALGVMCILSSTPKALILFLLAHSLYKSALFMGVGILDQKFGTRDIFKLQGVLRNNVFILAVFSISLASMVGLIPMFGFVAKELVIKSLLNDWILFPLFIVFTGYGVSAIRILWPMLNSENKNLKSSPEVYFILAPLAGCVISVVLGILPQLLNSIIEKTLAELGVLTSLDLHLWHGVTKPFLFSMGIILLSFLLAPFIALKVYKGRVGISEKLYEHFWRLVRVYSQKTVNAWHHFGTSMYLYIFFGFALLIVGGMFLTYWGAVFLPLQDGALFYEWATAALVVAGAMLALRADNIFVGVVGLALSGYGMALLFILFSSPDLALTQFLVETMTVILVCFIFIKFPSNVPRRRKKRVLVNSVFSIGVGVLTISIMWKVLSYPFSSSAANYFLKNAKTLGHGENVVNVAIVDFRAFDTLGEAFVVFLAGVGVASLFKLMPGYQPKREKE